MLTLWNWNEKPCMKFHRSSKFRNWSRQSFRETSSFLKWWGGGGKVFVTSTFHDFIYLNCLINRKPDFTLKKLSIFVDGFFVVMVKGGGEVSCFHILKWKRSLFEKISIFHFFGDGEVFGVNVQFFSDGGGDSQFSILEIKMENPNLSILSTLINENHYLFGLNF